MRTSNERRMTGRELCGILADLQRYDPALNWRKLAQLLRIHPNTLSRMKTEKLPISPRLEQLACMLLDASVFAQIVAPAAKAREISQRLLADPETRPTDDELATLVFARDFGVLYEAALEGDTLAMRRALLQVADNLRPFTRLEQWREVLKVAPAGARKAGSAAL